MTLAEIAASSKDMLTPADVALVLGSDPQTIRVMAHQAPELLGFNVCIVGNHVKIPRLAFLAFMGAQG